MSCQSHLDGPQAAFSFILNSEYQANTALRLLAQLAVQMEQAGAQRPLQVIIRGLRDRGKCMWQNSS